MRASLGMAILSVVLAGAMIGGCGCGGSDDDEPSPKLTLLLPNGGETWYYAGADQDITWTASHMSGNVELYYSTDNGANWTLIASVAATSGTYTWTVPDEDSAQCFVRIQDSDGVPQDDSDAALTIAPATVQVLAPNGGETWYYQGDDQDITWTAVGLTTVELQYSTDNGTSYSTIATVAADSSPYTWVIPDEDSALCLVRVQDADGVPADVSDATFTIAPATVTVTAANGGEAWVVGTNEDITWTSVGIIGTVDIAYSTDSGTSWTNLATGETDDGTYTWTIPDDQSTTCLIRVRESDGAPEDVSDAVFSIVLCSIMVTSPNGGETWIEGETHDITWTTVGTVGNLDIAYSSDGGTVWIDIALGETDDGSYTWPIPGSVDSSNCLVRVQEADGDPTDTSDVVFTIAPKTITVTAPNGGESWIEEENHDITWTSVGPVGNVDIAYSDDGGTNWVNIALGETEDGSYTWTIPGSVDSSNCLVRVQEADGDPTDTSDAVFTIVPKSIAVTAPNGGETWNIYTDCDITWTSVGIANIHIEISRDGGTSFGDVVASTPAAAGSYTWNVSAPESASCLIRVSDAGTGLPIDDSDAVFTIAYATVEWSSAAQSVDEGVGTVSVQATLSTILTQDVTVPYTVGGTATAADHDLVDGNLVVTSGNLTGSTTFNVTDDLLDEYDETVIATVGVPTNAVVGATTVHTVTITDNDPEPTVNFTLAVQYVGEEAGTATVEMTLDAVSGRDVTVPFTINVSSTATGGGSDYADPVPPITVIEGSLTDSVTFAITEDIGLEPDETIIFDMGTPTNAVAGQIDRDTVFIVDNDTPAANVFYVDPTGNDTLGDSWVNAFNTIVQGITAAVGAGGGEVWVGDGTYIAPAAANTFITMQSGVLLYGGFSGTDGAQETSRAQRDWAANVTTIDGNSVVNHVILGTSNAVLDGFTITGGLADGSSGSYYGAGMYNDNVTNTPIVANCTFTGNSSAFNAAGSQETRAAGMYLANDSSLWLHDCVFVNNSCSSTSTDDTVSNARGGAMYIRHTSAPTIDRCVFVSNSCTATIGASDSCYAYGGGVYVRDTAAPVFTDCIFDGNTVSVTSQQDCVAYGGGARIDTGSSPTFDSCTFVNNQAVATSNPAVGDIGGHDPNARGGGAYSYSCDVTFRDCVFDGNTCTATSSGSVDVQDAEARGGGVYSSNGGNQTYQDCTFTGNYTHSITNGTIPPCADCLSRGAGFYCYDTAANVTGCTFDGNETRVTKASIPDRAAGIAATVVTLTVGGYAVDSLVDWTCTFDTSGTEYGINTNDATTIILDSDASGENPADGLTLRSTRGWGYGGGTYNGGATGPTFTDCTMSNGIAYYEGGGSMVTGPATFVRCTFSDNVIAGRSGPGGAMYVGWSDAIILDCTDCVFRGNSAPNSYGGAVYIDGRPLTATFTGCTFAGNSCGSYGGGIRTSAIAPGGTTVTGCVFTGNTAAGNYGGAVYMSSNAVLSAAQCVFSGNTSGSSGGALYTAANAVLSASKCVFSANVSGNHAGAVYVYTDSVAAVENCLFYGNTAVEQGGAIRSYQAADVSVTNCTFTNNHADTGGGAIADNSSVILSVTNCIMWNDSAPSDPEFSGDTTAVSYCDIQGWTAGGTGNMDQDPEFVNGTAGSEDLHLQATSPCVDNGDPLTTLADDIEGTLRPQGSDFDIGAYEQ